MQKEDEGNTEKTQTGLTSDFYKKLRRDDLEGEILKRREDINHKSTGFFIFKAISEIFPKKEIGTVLDVGGNYGIFLKMLSEKYSIKRKVCLDIAEPSARIEDVEYLIGYAEETLKNLKENSADLVLLQDVIEHVFDPDRLLLKLKNVLKEGGIMIVSTPNLSSMINRMALLLGYEPMGMEVSTRAVFGRPGSSVAGHIRNFTYSALRDFFEYYGFHVVKQLTYVGYLPDVSSKFSKFIHILDKTSGIFGKKYKSQIFLVVRK